MKRPATLSLAPTINQDSAANPLPVCQEDHVQFGLCAEILYASTRTVSGMPAIDILGVAVFITIQVLLGALVYFSGKKHDSRSPLLAAFTLMALGSLSVLFANSFFQIVVIELLLVLVYFAAQGIVERWSTPN